MSPADYFAFHVITFGCKVNQYESQAIREYWTGIGGREVDEPASADVVLLASCAVTAEAVGDARQLARKLAREHPELRLLVTGCAASAAPADFALSTVAAVVPQAGKARLLDVHPLAEGLHALDREPDDEEKRHYPAFHITGFRRSRPVLKVQDGCSHRCTYCIVPLTRGPARSRDPEEALAEASGLLQAGFREIMISGVNLRQYDNEGRDFWKLLLYLDRHLAPEWEGKARFRLSSLEPAQLNDRGVDALASCRLLAPHLHLSLQSGSPGVLSRMGRRHYRPEEIARSLERLEKAWPTFGLGADILMGFPGETETELAETLAMVEALPLTYAHVFPWSSRPGTKAAEMPDQLPMKQRREHARLVRDLVDQKHRDFLQCQLALPLFRLAADMGGKRKEIAGINEYYVPCGLEGASSVPDHELIPVAPLRLENGRIVVAPRPLS